MKNNSTEPTLSKQELENQLINRTVLFRVEAPEVIALAKVMGKEEQEILLSSFDDLLRIINHLVKKYQTFAKQKV